MAAKTVKAVFEVEGSGHFPFDMLRYDSAWPVSSTDAANLKGRQRRTVRLASIRNPTMGRWNSFGWSCRVVDPFDMSPLFSV
jgi:hypothetical protein